MKLLSSSFFSAIFDSETQKKMKNKRNPFQTKGIFLKTSLINRNRQRTDSTKDTASEEEGMAVFWDLKFPIY